MPRFPGEGSVPPILPGLPRASAEPDDSSPVERVNVRGDGTSSSNMPAPSHTLRGMRPAPMDDGTLTRELPVLEFPDGESTGVSTRPIVPANPAARRGPQPSTSTVSEHSNTGTEDRARFDNGSERYDWDVTTDAVGDTRGRVGAGVSRGNTSAYVDTEFNETTGDIDARVSADHRLSDSTSVRGSVGSAGDGVNHVGAGATHVSSGGHRVDADASWNEEGGVSGEATFRRNHSAGHESVTVHGNEEGGGVSYSGSHAGAGVTSSERLSIDSNGSIDGRLDVEARREIRPGTTVSASGHVTTEGHIEGDARVDHRLSDHVSAHSSVGVDSSGVRSFEHGVAGTLADGRGNVAADINHSSDGRRSAIVHGSFGAEHGRHSGSARVSDSENGPVSVDATYGFDTPTVEGSSRTSFDADGRVDENGNWRAHARVEHRLNEHVRVTEDIRYDSNGRRVHRHSGEVDLGADRGRVGAEVTHDNEGHLSAEARYDWSEGSNAVGVRAGTRDGEHHVSGNYTHTRDTGSESLSGGYSSADGLHGEGRISRRVGENTEIDASISGSTRGDVSGEVGARTRLGDENDVNVAGRISGSTRDARMAGEVSVGRTANADRPGYDVRAGVSRDEREVGGNLGGSLNLNNLLGSALKATVGADAGVTLTKRYKAEDGFAWRGDMRAASLEHNPGEEFVSFAGRGRASVNVGGTIPMGVGYVNGGYKRGETYDVELTRLTDSPRFGERPRVSELNVPEDASALLGLRAGESFKIVGHSTHTSNGGGGVGSSIGAEGIGSIRASAGVDVTYVVSGRNTVDVTRGDGSSARIVVSAENNMTVGGDLKASLGATPDYAALGAAVGTDRLPNLGPAGDLVGNVAKGVVKRWLSATARAGGRRVEGTNRILDARIDLSDDVAKEAYNKAMVGDWTELTRLDRAGHPGVDMERSIFTELDERATPLTASGLGLGYKGEARESLRDSSVTSGTNHYKVLSDIDRNTRVLDAWSNKSSFSVTDGDRQVTGVDGASLGDAKADEKWLTWNHSFTENVASKDDVLLRMRLAEFVASGTEADKLRAYRSEIENVEDHRRMWVGPRNELRETTVTTTVSLGDKALDNVKDLSEAAVWKLYAKTWSVLHPNQPTPPWENNEVMPLFMDPTVMLAKSVVRIMEKNKATAIVKKLVRASKSDVETVRNDLIREVLAGEHGDPTVMAMVVDLVGRDNVKLALKVDSNAGLQGTQYDFSLTDTGSAFDVQKKVFGAEL